MNPIAEWNQTRTVIGRFVVRCPATQDSRSPVALRLRMERLLGSLDLYPPGLTSGTVLIVRKMCDLVHVSALSRLSQLTLAEHLHNQMATLYATAARPAYGAIPPSADSVLFADPGEMLICLTRDLLSGQRGQHWYWQQVLRHIPPTLAPALASVWSEHAAFTPLVLASLRPEEACAALTQLSSSEVIQVTHAVHRNFALPATVLTVLTATDGAETESAQLPSIDRPLKERAEVFSSQTEPAAERPDAFSFAPPWQRWLPNQRAFALLTPQAQYLLGLGLALAHAPTFARSSQFANRAATWLLRTSSEVLNERAAYRGHSGSEAPPNRARLDSSLLAEQKIERTWHHRDPRGKEAAPLSRRRQVSSLSIPSQCLPDIDRPLPVLAEPLRSPISNEAFIATTATLPDALLAKEALLAQPSTSGAARSLPTEGVLTELGGIFYLINLLNQLDLLAVCDEAGLLSDCLSGWGLLEALARVLSGALPDSLTADPVWDILTTLDQREHETPVGADQFEQTAFRLPAQWLRHYASANPIWTMVVVEEKRLRLFDASAGYLVVDVPLLARSAAEVMSVEIEAYQAQGISAIVKKQRMLLETIPAEQGGGHPSSFSNATATENANSAGLAPKVSGNLGWWLKCVKGFLCHLLARALGEPTRSAEQLVEMVLRRQGRVLVGRTHFDLHMSMEQVSLPVRRAGLDRDPAWVPDFGRIILFHFH